MNKKIIALAVAAGFAAAPLAAQAEMTVYGHAQVEVANWGGDAKGTSVEDNARGRFGIKASEDLGGGLKGIMKFEFKVDTADGNAGASGDIGKRETMVGLKGGWGEFQAGRLKTAYKYSGGVKYDPFVATVLEARGNNGMSGKVGVGSISNAAGHNGFVSDSLAYKGKFGNIGLWVTYDMDDSNAAHSIDTGGNAMTASLKFSQKNWEVFVALVDDDNDGATGQGYDSTKFGGMISFAGAHKISAQYEQADNGGTDEDTYYVDYQFKFGKNLLDVAIGDYDQDAAGVDSRAFARVALKHKFTKKTSTWVGYRASDTGNSTDESVISVGLRKDF